MSVGRKLLQALAETVSADNEVFRRRLGIRLDQVVALVLTALAVLLAIGYQVLGRWPHRPGARD
jgi:hypothetical protein